MSTYTSKYIIKIKIICVSDYTNRDLDQKKYKNEATIKGLEVEQRNLNAENKRLRTEVEQLRTDKENLGQGKFEQDSKISRLQDSLDVLKREKNLIADDLRRRNEADGEQSKIKEKLEKEIDEKNAEILKRKDQVKKVSLELVKVSNLVISFLFYLFDRERSE